MKTIVVEWRHLDKDGETCDRCAETGAGVAELVRDLAAECRGKGVDIVFRETKLTAADIDQSNLILIDGVPVEDILPDATVSESSCCSCSDLTGNDECCRTIVRFGVEHEAIPPQMVREAICKVAGCC
ncbi:MAG: DUF2703 domain-containing protein [Desulfuromonadales bacterium]|nr:DUF2703 domain-containing protein [Desulfuromonadales bacterium]